MSIGLTQITLIGNLGHDPAMTYTPDGMAVTRFSLAVGKKAPGKSADKTAQEVTIWYACTAFRHAAETINQYAQKGARLFVQGEFSPRDYTRKDGSQAISLDVVADTFVFLSQPQKPQTAEVAAEELALDESTPF
ncbi:MAG: single-stranded DNA-binding protein [Chloroflexota bacterium]|nr:single-stranded DNA-binding protein [Chloroflexota bacterium]